MTLQPPRSLLVASWLTLTAIAAGAEPPTAGDLAAAVAPLRAPESPKPQANAATLPTARVTTLAPGASRPIAPSTTSDTAASPSSPLTAIWQNNPIPTPLLVGQERRIDFPEPIADLEVPKDVEGQSQIILAPTGTLHWTARTPFAPVRVLATSVSGTLYQLQVEAGRDGAIPGPLVITDPVLEAVKANPVDERARMERAAHALLPPFLKKETSAAAGPHYAELARFALAHYTGPARLIPKLNASRLKVSTASTAHWLRVQSAFLETRPLAQWKIEPFYVTAVGVFNHSPAQVPFEPRALRGHLRFVAALHPILGPQGSGHSGTVWAVVTDQPFDEAIRDDAALTARR